MDFECHFGSRAQKPRGGHFFEACRLRCCLGVLHWTTDLCALAEATSCSCRACTVHDSRVHVWPLLAQPCIAEEPPDCMAIDPTQVELQSFTTVQAVAQWCGVTGTATDADTPLGSLFPC